MEGSGKLRIPTPAPRKSTSNKVVVNSTVLPPLQLRYVPNVCRGIKCEDLKTNVRLESMLEEIDSLPQVTRIENLVYVRSEQHALANDTDGPSCQNNAQVKSKKKKPAPSPPATSQKNDKIEINNRKDRPPLDASTHHETQAGCIETPEKIPGRPDGLGDAKPSLDNSILLAAFPQCYSFPTSERIPSQDNNNREFQGETSQLELQLSAKEKKRFGKMKETALLLEATEGGKMTEKVTATSGSYSKNSRPSRPPPVRRFASSPSKVDNVAVRQKFFSKCETNDDATTVSPKCAHDQRNEKLSSAEPEKCILPGDSRQENSTRAPQNHPIAKPRIKKRSIELEFSPVQITCASTPITTETKNSTITHSSGVVTELICQINELINNSNETSTYTVGQEGGRKNAYQQSESSEEVFKERSDVVYDGECCDDMEIIRL